MPFRTQPGVVDAKAIRTFETIKRTLEPTLYVLRYEMFFTDANTATDLPGSVYPIPYFFDPETGAKKKAWHRGSLVIDHMSAGVLSVVTVKVMAYVTGSIGVVLSTMVCDLVGAIGSPLTLKRFESELISQDLSPYNGIGLSYSLDEVPVMAFGFSSALLWRPSP